jgi:MoxR-like ATPase
VNEPVRSTPPSPPSGAASDVVRVQQLSAARDEIVSRLRQRIIGQDEVVELLLIALFARGHGLFVGVPGLAKTLLITTLADALSLHSNRIQFTPDLMPSDVTGTDVLEEDATTGKRHFRFIPGPVFTNILLADEVNRAPPKTQAALLQSMAEGQVTASGNTYALEQPYLVFATQNPIEQEGTYPLPEAQLDRFLLQIDVSYPDLDAERRMLYATTGVEERNLKTILSAEELMMAQRLVRQLPVGDQVVDAILSLVRSARPGTGINQELDDMIAWGPGPRASQALMLAVRAKAMMEGRLAPSVDDVVDLAEPVLKHRMALTFAARAEGIEMSDMMARLIEPLR